MPARSIVIQHEDRWLGFTAPETELFCQDPKDVPDLLRDIDAACERGKYVAGFLAYEAAAGLGLPTRAAEPNGPPLAHFGVYAAPYEATAPGSAGPSLPFTDWRPALERQEYADAIAVIHERIASGDTYQVNFTFPLTARWNADPWSLHAHLAAIQPGHNAFLDFGRFVIVSASPELFFSLDGQAIETRPMKGTAPRGSSPEDDDRAAAGLCASAKDRAENLMIVDMLRNDLGRVADLGSVVVSKLFEVERYPTVLQMTSTVVARTGASVGRILTALFPCASVTGAPKKRTMQIIASLEATARGVYTGAIGWVGPNRRARFNVAIRTVVIDRQAESATYGVGSGIVTDSVAEAEYAECLLKARVLTEG